MAKKRDEEGMRQRLIEAAETVFSHKSPMEVTMADVSAEAGLSKGTIYLYFKSRDELMVEMFRDCVTRKRGELSSFLESRGHLPKLLLLEQTLDYILDEINCHTRCWGLWYQFLALASSPRYREDILRIAQSHRRRRDELVADIIEKGKLDGTFHADADADFTASSLMALIDGFVLQAYIESVADWVTACRRAMSPLLNALRVPGE